MYRLLFNFSYQIHNQDSLKFDLLHASPQTALRASGHVQASQTHQQNSPYTQ